MLCSYIGTFGASSSGFMSCCFRSRFAASLRFFLDFENKSPSIWSSVFSPFFFKISQSQDGYSESSIATGSVLLLRKFKPFRGVPAGTDDKTRLGGAAALLDCMPVAAGEGVKSVLKGWAADVDVAGAGWCDESGESCRDAVVAVVAEMALALRERVVERARLLASALESTRTYWIRVRAAARIQRWQIM